MRLVDDPGQMTAEQRLGEVAAILARGFLRWKKCAKSATEPGKICRNPPEFGTEGLEVPGETRLSVRAG